MFSGSYLPEDVTFLLKPVHLESTDLVEKEQLIQSGQRHYSEMITREKLPSRITAANAASWWLSRAISHPYHA